MVDFIKVVFKNFSLRVVYILKTLLLVDATGQLKIILLLLIRLSVILEPLWSLSESQINRAILLIRILFLIHFSI